jgi:hypothetical protein
VTGADPVVVTGPVAVRRVAVGSKSERDAVVLDAGDRSWILRRPGGPAYGVDADLAALAGRTVTVRGAAGSGVLVVHEVDDADAGGSDGDRDGGGVG